MTLAEAWERSNDRARCLNDRSGLCKFEPYAEDESLIAERCIQCGKRESYRKIDGRIDNPKYLRDHIRDFLQPSGPTENLFWHVYGRAGYDRALAWQKLKKSKPTQEDWMYEARDTYKTLKKLIDSGVKRNEL